MINITAHILILSVFSFSCTDLTKEKETYAFVIKPEFKKYEHFINDARFKIYLKMGMQKVAVKDAMPEGDSVLLGAMNLALVSCQELNAPMHKGLLVGFVFRYNDNAVYYSNTPFFVSSVFYREMDIKDWFFAYGELSVIYYDIPNKIDTLQVLRHLNKREILNPWFKKRIEDSILNNKNKTM